MTDQLRLGPPVIEPLSDVSWARVERDLWSRMTDARSLEVRPIASRRWWWLAAPALAAAGLALVLGTRGSEPVASSGSDEQPLRVVSSATPSSVTLGDAHVTLDSETAMVMSGDRDSQRALLERGAAWFSIAPRAGRPPFVVLAGDAVVRVVGTRFRVARSDERATVEVEHGIVEVQYRGVAARLVAGQRWSSEQPTRVTAVRPVSPVAPPVVVPAVVVPAVVVPAVVVPAIVVPAVVVPAIVVPPVVVPPVAAAPAARPDVRIVDARSPELQPVPSSRDRKVGETRSVARPVGDADRAQFDRMQALEVRAPKAAIAGYLELTRSARWAEVALFAAGRLAADQRDRRAVQLLTDYLRRFPTGANVADARELLVHLKGEH